MMRVEITQPTLEYIKFHAQENRGTEIYGWPLGFKKNDTISLVAPYSCHLYLKQTQVNAEPDPSELSKLDTILPFGIANMGMYHSHPVGVFHSHTDNKTLLDMSKTDPDIVSIVTNGTTTEFFLVEQNRVKEIEPNVVSIPISFTKYEILFNLNLSSEDNKFKVASEIESQLEKLDSYQNGVVNHTSGTDRKIRLKVPFYFRYLPQSPQILSYIQRRTYEIVVNNFEKLEQLTVRHIDYFGVPLVLFSNIESFPARLKLIEKFHQNY